MTTYAIHTQVITHDGGFDGSRSVPTFYLDSRVQGILSKESAARVAEGIINPLGLIAAADLKISAYEVDPMRESADLEAATGRAPDTREFSEADRVKTQQVLWEVIDEQGDCGTLARMFGPHADIVRFVLTDKRIAEGFTGR